MATPLALKAGDFVSGIAVRLLEEGRPVDTETSLRPAVSSGDRTEHPAKGTGAGRGVLVQSGWIVGGHIDGTTAPLMVSVAFEYQVSPRAIGKRLGEVTEA